VSRSFGPRVVLDQISLTISPRSRIGVIAPNGTGKSTLLRLVARLDRPDSGAITRLPPSATVGYLPQEPERVPDETLHAFLQRRTGVAAATIAFEAATRALAAGEPGTDEPTTLTPTHFTPTWRSAPPTSTRARALSSSASDCRPRCSI
jgi:ATPase subunit of ABC transporter with duplicated ATPase domains